MSLADSRTEQLLGKEAFDRLSTRRVAVVGLGGVGSMAAEALVRAGLRDLVIIDFDRVDGSNINRQIVALHSTIGRLKVDAMKERLLDIRPDAHIETHAFFCTAQGSEGRIRGCDYVVDAIDTVLSKIGLILECRQENIPVISSMGAGNKLDPELLEIGDLFSTSVCPLARVLRRELRKAGVTELPVVFSREIPTKPQLNNVDEADAPTRRIPPGSISFVPTTAGLLAAGKVIRDLAADRPESRS